MSDESRLQDPLTIIYRDEQLIAIDKPAMRNLLQQLKPGAKIVIYAA